MIWMWCKEGILKLSNQRHPPAIRQFGGVEREKDLDGWSNIHIFTYRLESYKNWESTMLRTINKSIENGERGKMTHVSLIKWR